MAKANLARIPLKDLQREIERRRAEFPKLIAERDALNRRIAELEGLVAPKPPAKKAAQRSRRGKSKPAKGTLTLNDALAQVLQGKGAVSVIDATEGVLALGYKTRSKNPRSLVNQALHRGERFQRVGRGRYALKA